MEKEKRKELEEFHTQPQAVVTRYSNLLGKRASDALVTYTLKG